MTEIKIAKVKPEVSQEMIDALAKLREHVRYYSDIRGSFDLLDNAGVFAAIDAATPPQIDLNKCTCTGHPGFQKYGYHLASCLGVVEGRPGGR